MTVPARPIPEHLRQHQTRASDPQTSVWVSANAGSGKTHVLTQRVIRLLLNGVPPAKILCLTFTKAAAAEMSKRVFERLSAWTTLSDDKLRAAILDMGAPPPRPETLTLARRLFTRTVETPGGLKIQTIHAFCERLLHLFPFEANVPARFEVADDLRAGELLGLAKRGAIEAGRHSTSALGAALLLVAETAGSTAIDKVIVEGMARRKAAKHLGHDVQRTLSDRLGADRRFASAEAVQVAMVEGGIAPSRWPGLADIFDGGGKKSDGEQASRLRAAAAAYAHVHADAHALAGPGCAEVLASYMLVFFTAKDEPKRSLVTAALGKAHPDLKRDLEAEQQRLGALLAARKIADTVERTAALVLLLDEIIARYEQGKITHGMLDFDDLIERTLALLKRSDAGWVLHKLDAGIDHVLVDEAQDTSEAQWKILEHLTGDFAAGAGARGQDRSFFVVGDDKQSIFSFQGAAPLMFDNMRSAFERRFLAADKRFERIMLKTSFRSVPGVLAAVDTVFDAPTRQDGLVRAPDVWPRHESIKSHLPGLVEIWPRIKADAPVDPGEWVIPVDVPSEQDPANIVADRVAKKIAMMLAAGSGDRVHEGEQKRPVRAGDVLILVRTRGPFFEAVIRALKRENVPVAGADRLDVGNHIAVMDLVAAGRAALLPDDDLSVACVLKSPLFGFTDDDLVALAPHRTGPLLAALKTSGDARHRAAHATLLRWSERAVAVTPFAFYVELLGRDGGRRLMEARLGPEAHDAIDELIRLTLIHERLGAPSLSTFLAEVEALDTSVKRDMESASDVVRVMTVHAAKGLEAKIVFLPDTCAVPAQSFDPVVFDLNKDTGVAPVLVWSPRKSDDPDVVAEIRTAERQAVMREYRRLLYVALTRAEERLYIAGFFHTRAPPDDCWSAMITAAFADQPTEQVQAFWSDEETVTRIATPGHDLDLRASTQPPEQRALPLCPNWLFESLPTAARPLAALAPSHVETRRTREAGQRTGIAYGLAIHELLQHLPGVAPDGRLAAGRAFLRTRESYPREIHEAVLTAAVAVIAEPALAMLFAPGARAEVAVTGHLPGADGRRREIDGKVDRLVVTPHEVVIADFKSGRPPSRTPPAYLDQLALYRQVLMPLFPNRVFRTLLVWTQGPIVVELDPAELDAAVAAVFAAA